MNPWETLTMSRKEVPPGGPDQGRRGQIRNAEVALALHLNRDRLIHTDTIEIFRADPVPHPLTLECSPLGHSCQA